MLKNSYSCRLQNVPVVLSVSALLPCAEVSASPAREKGALGSSEATGTAVGSRLKPAVQLGIGTGTGNSTTQLFVIVNHVVIFYSSL